MLGCFDEMSSAAKAIGCLGCVEYVGCTFVHLKIPNEILYKEYEYKYDSTNILSINNCMSHFDTVFYLIAP